MTETVTDVTPVSKPGPHRPGWPIPVAAGIAGVGVLAWTLHIGHGLNATTITGRPDPGTFTNWALPIVTFLSYALVTAAVGLTVTAAFLLPGADKSVSPQGYRLLRAAGAAAIGWALTCLALIVFTASDILGQPISRLGVGPVTSFATDISQGQALAVQAGMAVAVAAIAMTALRRSTAAAAAVIAVLGVLPPALTGHAAGAGNHQIAVSSLALHVGAATLWTGGLLALLTLRRSATLPDAAARYSRLALGCFIVVAVSGITNAWVRLGSWSQLWHSTYGTLVFGKVAALLVLGAIGALHRFGTLAALRAGRRFAFVRLAAGELIVFAATFGLAVALSRSPEPAGSGADADPIVDVLGFNMPAPITAARLFGDPLPDMFFLAVTVVGLYAYLAGVWRMRKAGHAWPVSRTVSWVAGLLIMAAVTNLGISRYAYVLFSVHMAQHMVLAMLVPILLVGGAPATLALRALRRPADPNVRGARDWLLIVLHSRATRFFTNPLVALAIYTVGLYGLYFTNLLTTLMTYHLGHLAMLAHFIVSGYLMFWVLIGIDPGRPRLQPHIAILIHFASMVFHAFLGVILLQSTTVIAPGWYSSVHPPWAKSLLDDQHLGAGIAWAFGEIPAAVVFLILIMRWMKSDAREQARLDRAAVRAEANNEEDDLARYNAFLAAAAAEARGEPPHR
jgi:cytochrome c oxidase assembly factor CtaG/putative copper export protein